jgi:hypothetical protein
MKGPPLLQTFVFSATLTLPEKLRRRLRKGVWRGYLLFLCADPATPP